MAYDLSDSFSIAFNIMKLKYVDYDTSLDRLDFLAPDDKVNVFINLESVLNLISTIKDVDKKVILESANLSKVLASNILNLGAHYKRFFRGNHLPTRVFLYMTDLESVKFNEYEYNEDYRSYYINKYTSNPRFVDLTDVLIKDTIPMVKKIVDFIPGVYFINSKNIDGSLVPLIVSKDDISYKNLIITGDVFETQYGFYNNFVTHFLRRSPLYNSTTCTIQQFLKEAYKRVLLDDEYELFSNRAFYITMLSSLGEKYRSIDSIKGVGTGTVLKQLYKAVNVDNSLSPQANTIDSIKCAFSNELEDELIVNFKSYDIEQKDRELTESQRFSILEQIIDRFDKDSLIQLNNTLFYEHRLMLEELTM